MNPPADDLTLDLARSFRVPGAGWVFEFLTNAPLDAEPPYELSVFATRRGLANPDPAAAARMPGSGPTSGRPSLVDSFTTSSLGITRTARHVIAQLAEGATGTPPRSREIGAVRAADDSGLTRVGLWIPTPALQRMSVTVAQPGGPKVHHLWAP